MAAVLEVNLSLKLDGKEIDGSPFVRRLSSDESQSFNYSAADGAGYVPLPITQLAEVRALFVRADQALTFRFDGQSDAGVPINAGGLLLLLNVDLDDGASTNATADNSSGNASQVRGVAIGT